MQVHDLMRFLTSTPQRGQIALALGLATRAAEAYRGDAGIEALLKETLDLAWRWLGGEDIRAAEIHVHYERIVDVEMATPAHTPARMALVAAGIAFGYLNARAYEIDVARGLVAPANFPGDMCEYGEERVEEVCEYAQGLLGPAFDGIYAGLVAGIAARVAGHSAQEWGPALTRPQIEGAS